jgi:hypothetical protein
MKAFVVATSVTYVKFSFDSLLNWFHTVFLSNSVVNTFRLLQARTQRFPVSSPEALVCILDRRAIYR